MYFFTGIRALRSVDITKLNTAKQSYLMGRALYFMHDDISRIDQTFTNLFQISKALSMFEHARLVT